MSSGPWTNIQSICVELRLHGGENGEYVDMEFYSKRNRTVAGKMEKEKELKRMPNRDDKSSSLVQTRI
ncbi:unnamed protein product [Macrosiphum euphorbiae]|uniref:Uncharacterized protein n=1 Tax=Macrosiphum euphorbiae TaxID=13131 RepID=A0AAV0XKB0_9HEMI|nr:unnamed protein product [Macrosiphum euphorbiae]